ncbi:hypothetical protein AN641_09500 [Candidatus Epulonipiscioides gigas]|nr:hypothetical protein AN641_09500 [Epulopiscium sp. SCG-C07WGA-EpuloA2]
MPKSIREVALEAENRKKKMQQKILISSFLIVWFSTKVLDINFLSPSKLEEDVITVMAPITQVPPLFEDEGVLTKHGENEFLNFIKNFYENYSLAITHQNTSYLQEFIDERYSQVFLKDFNSWFIDNKVIEKAEVSTAIENATINLDNSIDLEILETIYLTNRDETNLIRYKINLLWSVNIIDVNNTFKLGVRSLKESIVAYEYDGEWIKY